MTKLIMQRSQTQIATTYAPDKHFTFEGGDGSCRSVPISHIDTEVSPAERNQIREGVLEFVQNWLHRATLRTDPPVLAKQALDEAVFLDPSGNAVFDASKFAYCKPERMAYRPDPLVLVCRQCHLVHEPKLSELAYDNGKFRSVGPCNESSDGAHEWRQLDVVYAHWSGRVDPLSPFRKDIDTDLGKINQQFPGRCTAGLKCAFKLHRGRSGRFRDWYFHCHCGERRELIQKDEYTLEWLVDRYAQDPGETLREINMLPVSYRANSLYYVQSDQLIAHESTDHIDLMAEEKQDELTELLLRLYGYSGARGTDAEIISALRGLAQPAARAHADKMQEILNVIKSLTQAEQASAADALRTSIAALRQQAVDQGWIDSGPAAPPELTSQVRARAAFTRKFDPIRLGVEHETLRREQLQAPVPKDAARPVVDLASPDKDLEPVGTELDRLATLQAIQNHKLRLGFQDLKLLRNLRMLQYSFGFSRVSPTPTTSQKGLSMPVRLCGFPKIEGGKRPIYVLRQNNEALYVRLDEARVVKWLESNGLGVGLDRENGPALGGRIIEEYLDFGRFAESYSETRGDQDRDVPVFVFGLLHSLAHQLIHICSRFSGLDLGSFGERLFPADLAFLIYRKGMTPDLGNLAAMWRNHGSEVLQALDSPRNLRCGSGSLCDHRGGACPACIMIPEVSCLAGNNILSRSLLNGGPPLSWDTNQQFIRGYFESAEPKSIS